MKTTFLFIACAVLSLKGKGLVLPDEGAVIHHTYVYLQEEVVPGAVAYEVDVSSDPNFSNGQSYTFHSSNRLPAFHADKLNWHCKYHWRIKAYDINNTLLHESALHSFYVRDLAVSFANAEELFLEVKTNNAEKNAGGLIAIDYLRSIYDRQGHAVWTVPNITGCVTTESQLRDLKLTEDNTITFLTEKSAVEIDFEGNVLWKAPVFVFHNDTLAYHHELQKTKKGTYLVMGTRKVKRLMPGNYTAEQLQYSADVTVEDKKVYKKSQVTVILEFDKNGKLLWFWDADTYLTNEDLAYKKYKNGMPFFSSHANAFSQSADGKNIYVSFRDLSRIVKIDKASKKVLRVYGEQFSPGQTHVAKDAFRRQHDGTVTSRGTLLIFNNNESGNEKEEPVSGFVELLENPVEGQDPVVWSFQMDFDKGVTASYSSGGGNMNELPNGNFLVCAGTINRLMEVTREKEIVWDAVLSMTYKGDKTLHPFPQYRCSWLPGITDYHFMATVTESMQDETIDLSLTNTGWGDDSYTVELLSEGKLLYKTKTSKVATNEHIEQILPVRSFHPRTHAIVVRVTSDRGNYSSQLVPATEVITQRR